jgi:uncharacterized protein YdaU (DUF1376 family)
MAKDPAFLFYPGDFTTGTQFFTDEQVGKYIRLLMAQHQLGHLKESHMIMICKSYDNDIFSKFTKDSDGNYFNQRLEDEIIKRKKYSLSRSKNRSGEKIISNSYVNHMENKNKDININTNINNNIGIGQFFESLLNGSDLETIAMNNKITLEGAKKCVEIFRPKAELSYQSYAKFVAHFKNWLAKNPYKDPFIPKLQQ